MTDAQIVTPTMRRHYDERGYFTVEGFLEADELATLQAVCDRLVLEQDAEMERAGEDTLGLSERGRRYFVTNAREAAAEAADVVFGDRAAAVCRATIGDDAVLFWEHFVVKMPTRVGSAFAWHQDSGYVDSEHKPYVNCWVALDDMTEANGTLYMLPYDRAGTRERIEHARVPNSHDRVGFDGDDPGDAMVVPAGTAVVFSSLCLHRLLGQPDGRAATRVRDAVRARAHPRARRLAQGAGRPLPRGRRRRRLALSPSRPIHRHRGPRPSVHAGAPSASRRLSALPSPRLMSNASLLRYQDPSLPVADRVADLLGQMTLDEKIAQLGSYWGYQFLSSGGFDADRARDLLADGVGQITRAGGSTNLLPQDQRRLANEIQRFLVEETRLGDPGPGPRGVLLGLHGARRDGVPAGHRDRVVVAARAGRADGDRDPAPDPRDRRGIRRSRPSST